MSENNTTEASRSNDKDFQTVIKDCLMFLVGSAYSQSSAKEQRVVVERLRNTVAANVEQCGRALFNNLTKWCKRSAASNSVSISGQSIALLSVLTSEQVIKYSFADEAVMYDYVDVVALLAHLATNSTDKLIINIADKKLRVTLGHLFDKLDENQFRKLIASFATREADEDTLEKRIVLIAESLAYLRTATTRPGYKGSNREKVAQVYSETVESVQRRVLQCFSTKKSEFPQNVLRVGLDRLFNTELRGTFVTEALVPVVRKQLMRNPESVCESVLALLSACTAQTDLTSQAAMFTGAFISPLCAESNASLRARAIDWFAALARNITDSRATMASIFAPLFVLLGSGAASKSKQSGTPNAAAAASSFVDSQIELDSLRKVTNLDVKRDVIRALRVSAAALPPSVCRPITSGTSIGDFVFTQLATVVSAEAVNESVVCELLRCAADCCRAFLLRAPVTDSAESPELDAAVRLAQLCLRDKQFAFSVRMCALQVANMILFAADRRRYTPALRGIVELYAPLASKLAQAAVSSAGSAAVQQESFIAGSALFAIGYQHADAERSGSDSLVCGAVEAIDERVFSQFRAAYDKHIEAFSSTAFLAALRDDSWPFVLLHTSAFATRFTSAPLATLRRSRSTPALENSTPTSDFSSDEKLTLLHIRVLLFAFAFADSNDVRSSARAELRKTLLRLADRGSDHLFDWCVIFVRELRDLLTTFEQKAVGAASGSPTNDAGSGSASSSTNADWGRLKRKRLAEPLSSLLSVVSGLLRSAKSNASRFISGDSFGDFVIETSFACNHPFIRESDASLWSRFIKLAGGLESSAKPLATRLSERFAPDLVAFYSSASLEATAISAAQADQYATALTQLVRFLPSLQTDLIALTFAKLVDTRFAIVSSLSIAIMNTDPDCLFDADLVREAQSQLAAAEKQRFQNVKKESKLYSHKDQLAELELRKELERRNAASETHSARDLLSKLSGKLREQFEAKFNEERGVRERTKALVSEFDRLVAIVVRCIAAIPKRFCDVLFDEQQLLSVLDLFKLPLARVTRLRCLLTEVAIAVFSGASYTIESANTRVYPADCIALEEDSSKHSPSIGKLTHLARTLSYAVLRTRLDDVSRLDKKAVTIAPIGDERFLFSESLASLRSRVLHAVHTLFFTKPTLAQRDAAPPLHSFVNQFVLVLPLLRAVLCASDASAAGIDEEEEKVAFTILDRFTTHFADLAFASGNDAPKQPNDAAIDAVRKFPIRVVFMLVFDWLIVRGTHGVMLPEEELATRRLVTKMAAYARNVIDNQDSRTASAGGTLVTLALEKRVTYHSNSTVRKFVVMYLRQLEDSLLRAIQKETDLRASLFERVVTLREDEAEAVRQLASEVLDISGKLLDDSIQGAVVSRMLETLTDATLDETIQAASARALGTLFYGGELNAARKQLVSSTLDRLIQVYDDLIALPATEIDQFGRARAIADVRLFDRFVERRGIARGLKCCAKQFMATKETAQRLFEFFVPRGLNDRNETVRDSMMIAAIAAIDEGGAAHIGALLPQVESFLANAPASADYDTLRQNLIIVLGSLAKHMTAQPDAAGKAKVRNIVEKLLETLNTPSEPVQRGAATQLSALMVACRGEERALVDRLMQQLFESEQFATRRGAAFGLAGVIKGFGSAVLTSLNVKERLVESLQDKRNAKRRESALFAFETLSALLGRQFEPYVVDALHDLLLCFGDGNVHVREAADSAARVLMGQLSAHGVKLVLPSLIRAIDDDAWRTKAGSVELLKSFAFCAPKQLNASLPQIVPKLMLVLTDSHEKVQRAGIAALETIASVVKNPQIARPSTIRAILETLQNPTSNNTSRCLVEINAFKFAQRIDTASLSLLMPIIERSFADRSSENRRQAAVLLVKLLALADAADSEPYAAAVIPGLKLGIVDPVPEIRRAYAEAIGALVRTLGDKVTPDLLGWLMERLVAVDGGSIDREGAALGIAQVIAALGTKQLAKVMDDLDTASRREDAPVAVRDGYMLMYYHLPDVFRDQFAIYVRDVIPRVLTGLADESECVRETSYRTGQKLIALYANEAVEHLLPALESGLGSDNWRIRVSSVRLIGDLLFTLTGVSGRGTTESADDDDTFGTETSQTTILRSLGSSRRDALLAGLYVARNDVALPVRTAALHIWKSIVSNTARALRDVLPTLIAGLLRSVSSSNAERRTIASRTLGDVVKKLGERVLPELIPLLSDRLVDPATSTPERHGVYVALIEVMDGSSRDNVTAYSEMLEAAVRRGLLDASPQVRSAAASACDRLFSNIGNPAFEHCLPALVDCVTGLDAPKRKGAADVDPAVAQYALDSLRQLATLRSRVVMNFLVPRLTENVTPSTIRVLAALCHSGEGLSKHLSRVLPAVIGGLHRKYLAERAHEATELSAELVDEIEQTSQILSMSDEASARIIVDDLVAVLQLSGTGASCLTDLIETARDKLDVSDEDSAVLYANSLRVVAAHVLSKFVQNAPPAVQIPLFVPALFRGLLGVYTIDDQRLLTAVSDCLGTILRALDRASADKATPADPAASTQAVGVGRVRVHVVEATSSVRTALRSSLLDLTRRFGETEGELSRLVHPNPRLSRTLRSVVVPGMRISAGLKPLTTMLKETMFAGSSDLRESAARECANLARFADGEALRSCAPDIAGPAIRILGERFSSTVRACVVDAVHVLLVRNVAAVRAYLPQLQPTLLKVIASDSDRRVRIKAATCISRLVTVHTKPDAFLDELVKQARANENTAVRDAFLQSLRLALVLLGTRLGSLQRARSTLITTLNNLMRLDTSSSSTAGNSSKQQQQLDAGSILGIGLAAGGVEDSTRQAIACCFGALFASFDDQPMSGDSSAPAYSNDPDYQSLCSTALFGKPGSGPTPIEWQNTLLRGTTLQIALRDAPAAILRCADVRARALEFLRSLLASDRVPLALCGVRSAAYYLAAELQADSHSSDTDFGIINELARLIKTDSTHTDVKQHVAMAVAYVYRTFWHSFESRVVDQSRYARAAIASLSEFEQYEAEAAQLRLNLVESMLANTDPRSAPLAYSAAVLKPLCTALVNGCKERNTVVRSNSEVALIELAQLTNESIRDTIVEHCLSKLEGLRDATAELLNGSLKRTAQQQSANRGRLAFETVLEQSLFAIAYEIEDPANR